MMNPFKDGFCGKLWWVGFKKRHPKIILQTMKGLDRNRSMNLCPIVVTQFYDNMSKAYDVHSLGNFPKEAAPLIPTTYSVIHEVDG